jgi:hypothetical protein
MIVTKSGEEVYITSEDQLEEYFNGLGLPVPYWDFDEVVNALRDADPVHYLVEEGFAGFKITEIEVL